mgnify:CR=1 FL=1
MQPIYIYAESQIPQRFQRQGFYKSLSFIHADATIQLARPIIKIPKTKIAKNPPSRSHVANANCFQNLLSTSPNIRGSIYPLVGKETEGEKRSVSIGVGRESGKPLVCGGTVSRFRARQLSLVRLRRRLYARRGDSWRSLRLRRRLQDYMTPMLRVSGTSWHARNAARIRNESRSLSFHWRKETKKKKKRRKLSLFRSLSLSLSRIPTKINGGNS